MKLGLPASSSWQRYALLSLATSRRGGFCWTTALRKTTSRLQSFPAEPPAPSSLASPILLLQTPWRCFSSSSSSSTSLSSLSRSEEKAPLQQWLAALSQISAHDLNIDPDVVGDNKEDTYVQALLGDKILGSAAATALVTNARNETQQQHTQPAPAESQARVVIDTGSLTKRISYAVSNSFLAEHVDQILPGYHIDRSSEWEIGTAVEAAVYAVHRIQPAAVMELAQFLVQHAARAAPVTINAKGEFLERGGRFDSSRRVGGTDHDPIYEATAVCQGHTATSRAPTKKRAEMEAAQHVLELLDPPPSPPLRAVEPPEWNHTTTTPSATPTTTSLGIQVSNVTVIPPPPFPTNNTNDDNNDNAIAAFTTYGQWEPFEVLKGIELKDGETARDWWWRGAENPQKAFDRAMLAAQVFPDQIAAVDSWVRRVETTAASVFVLVVDAQQQCHYVPAITAASGTRARRIVGVQANQIIADLVGVQLSSSNDHETNGENVDTVDCDGSNSTTTMAAEEKPAWEQLTVVMLRTLLRGRGLSVSGNKAQLVERLRMDTDTKNRVK